MTDIQKLKALAEAADQSNWSYLVPNSPATNPDGLALLLGPRRKDMDRMTGYNADDARYIATANPAAVLDLIAEIDRLQAAKATLDRLGYTDNGGQLWKPPLGKKPDFDLIDQLKAAALEDLRLRTELMEQFNQLKAENESLRKAIHGESQDLSTSKHGEKSDLSTLSALRKDAERYRWLRVDDVEQYAISTRCSEEKMDAAIDAAMSNGGDHG